MLWLVVVVHGLLMLHHHHLLLSGLTLRHHLLLHANRHVLRVHHLRRVNLLLLRHLLHHNRLFEHVHVARVLHVVDENVELGFANTFRLQKVLDSVQIEAHLRGLLHEHFTLVHEVLGDLPDLVRCWTH